MATHVQAAFTGGELAESAWGRVDLNKFHASAARIRNAFVHVHGGISNRGGTMFVGRVSDHAYRHRCIDFQFNVQQAYMLVFGHQRMRVVRNGGLVLEDALAIEGITQALPCVVTITAHGLVDGQELYIGDPGGMVELGGRFFIVRNPAADTFELEDVWERPVDSTDYTAWSSGGALAAIYELVTPWAAEHLRELGYDQQLDVITITHELYQPQDITRTDHNAWTIAPFVTASSVPAPQNIATSDPGSYGDITVTAVIEDEESLPGTEVAVSNFTTGNVEVSWDAVAGAEHYNVYARQTGDGVFGFVGRVEAPGTSFKYVDELPLPDYNDVPPSERVEFDSPGEYPGTTTYYDGRQCFGRTVNEAQVIKGSSVTGYTNFNRSIVAKASDAWTYVLNGRRGNAIQHLVALDKLIILTSGAEWLANGSDGNGTITPTDSPGIRPRTYNGASKTRPLVVESTILYVQEQGSIVRDFAYTLEQDNFSGTDLTVLAPHLVEGFELVESAWAQVPERLAWYVRDDGQLLTMAYMREHDIWAWSTHDTWLGGFESVGAIPEGNESAVYFEVERTINGRNVRYIERLHTRNMRDPETKELDQRRAFHVDCGLTYDVPQTVTGLTNASPAVLEVVAHGWSDGDWVDLERIAGDVHRRETDTLAEAVNGMRFEVKVVDVDHVELLDYQHEKDPLDTSALAPYRSGGIARKAVDVISGFDHLEGEQLAVVGNANVLTNGFDDEIPITVIDGKITLPSRHSIVHAGLGVETDIVTLPLPIAQGGRKQVSRLVVNVENTRGLLVGPSLDLLVEARQRFEEPWGAPVSLFTGQYPIDLYTEWELSAQLALRQRDPLPLSLLSILPDVEAGH